MVSVDGRKCWFATGSNGAIAAINTFVSTFAAGADPTGREMMAG